VTVFLAVAVRVAVFVAGAFVTVFLAVAVRVAVFLAGAVATVFLVGAFATVFLAGVLVAVRFTGFEVAGLTLVAATYTLSVCWRSTGHGRASPKASAMGNIGAISLWNLSAVRLAGAGIHCND
jgi:hypothetical protein